MSNDNIPAAFRGSPALTEWWITTGSAQFAAAEAERAARRTVEIGFNGGGVFTFDETPTVDAGHLGACLLSALFGDEAKCDHVMPDGTTCDAPAPHCVGGEQYFCDEHEIECPATADGKHFYEQQEDVTGRIVWGCDCGALPPERDPDDF